MDCRKCLALLSLCFVSVSAQPVIPTAPQIIQCVDGESAILLKHEGLSPQTEPDKIVTASLQECSDYCSNNEAEGEAVPCVGFKYSPRGDICDLYSAFTVFLPSEVDFFQKTCVGEVGASDGESSARVEEPSAPLVPSGLNPTVPTTSECSEDESAVMIMHGQSGPVESSSHIFAELSLDECSKICRTNMDTLTGEKISCAGFDYDLPTKTCKTFQSFHAGTLQFGAVDFYQKTCVQTTNVCSSAFAFEMKPQQILVGFAREVVTTPSVSECLKNCLTSIETLGFECESVMYYPTDQECILNTEDRRDRPDLFVPEDQDEVIYFDNNCAGSQCFAPYVTQYIRVEGRALVGERDLVVTDVSLEGCEEICTSRISSTGEDFSCKSFTYQEAQRTCVLADERAKPVGRADFAPDESSNYYEKKCFSSNRVCRNVPSFERVPQMILVGFAAFVLESVPSVTQCLDNCVSPPEETGADFECKSVMYYYNEQECILNTETRVSQPELFIPEGEGFQVDYFDISCSRKGEICPEGTVPTSIRTKGAALPLGEDSIFRVSDASGDAMECRDECYALHPAKCRSFNYDGNAATCDLLYIKDTAPVAPAAGVDSYKLTCLGGFQSPAQFEFQLKEGQDVFGCKGDAAAFDRYPGQMLKTSVNQTMGPMLSVSDCLNACLFAPFQCQAVNYHVKSGKCELMTEKLVKPGDEVASRKRRQASSNLFPQNNVDCYFNNCKGFRGFSGTGSGGAASGGGLPLPPVAPPPGPLPFPVHQPPPGPGFGQTNVQTICNFDGLKVVVRRNAPFGGAVFVKNKYDSCRVEVFNQESTVLQLGFPLDSPPTVPIAVAGVGAAFRESDKETIQEEIISEDTETEEVASRKKRQYGGGDSNVLGLGVGESFVDSGSLQTGQGDIALAILPVGIVADAPAQPSLRDCGVKDLGNYQYGATVVVQSNNLGIPGLVTSMDDIYEVTCDYNEMLGRKVQAGSGVRVEGPVASIIQPQGKIELASPVMLHMLNAAGESNILQAQIGDILELRWEMMALDDQLDFFVRECVASRGETHFSDGNDIEGAPGTLVLIDRGCPTPAVSQKLITEPIRRLDSRSKSVRMQAFRFDGSQSVRVICKLDICQGTCNPVACNLPGGQQESFGRKKRDTIDNENVVFAIDEKLETNRYAIPKHPKATATLVIVDPLQDPSLTASFRSHQKPVEVVRKHQYEFEQEAIETGREGKVCLPKSTFLGVFLFLGLLAMTQAVVVAAYTMKRCGRKQA